MHWRKPFPPKRPSVLSELIALMRGSMKPETLLAPAPELPDELPAAELHDHPEPTGAH